MIHPLVNQLRFARSEFKRGLAGLTEEAAARRFLPMNSISWNVGHLSWQEQRYWLRFAQGKTLLPDINERFAYGAPASTPSLNAMWEAWTSITTAADPWLDAITADILTAPILIDGKPRNFTYGNLLLRTIYHYWYHTGENMAIRQQLGHTDLPQFVGDIDGEAPYQPE